MELALNLQGKEAKQLATALIASLEKEGIEAKLVKSEEVVRDKGFKEWAAIVTVTLTPVNVAFVGIGVHQQLTNQPECYCCAADVNDPNDSEEIDGSTISPEGIKELFSNYVTKYE